ncbi:hypothetical protein [Actinomadura logoneensis]|uniref:hypothetical protein n=1 Tax=Actinomadura logoneensis TaxID=2293572 RepID=UPI0018F21202|nr:hypothetical protein [Actinomadura logoneensis]
MPDPPVPPSRWGDSPPWWLTAEALDDVPPPSGPTGPTGPSGPSGPSGGGAKPETEPPAPAPVAVADAPRPRAAETAAALPRRKIMVLGAVGGLCAAAIAAAGGALLLDGGSGKPEKRITLASRAGGLHRDATDPAASPAYPFIAEAVRRGGVGRTRQKSAVYSDEARTILFVGGSASISDPDAFLVRAKPNTVLAFRRVGRGVCGTFAVLSAVHPYCAWATSGSYGFVASNVPAPDADDLAKLLPRMRGDLER